MGRHLRIEQRAGSVSCSRSGDGSYGFLCVPGDCYSVTNIAVTVPMLNRVDALRRLLESVPATGIEQVYVGDNGRPSVAKQALYEREFPFELEVLNLSPERGLAAARHELAKRANEEFLVVCDSDHQLPPDVTRLREVLEARPDLGGVAGLVWEEQAVWSACHDFYEEGNLLIRDIRDKRFQRVADLPVVEFDHIGNIAVHRRTAICDSSWDSNCPHGHQHLDFFLSQFHRTDWGYAMTPAIPFRHVPDRPRDYVSHTNNPRQLRESKHYVLEKWDYRQILNHGGRWIETHTQSPPLTPRRILGEVLHRVSPQLPAWVQALIQDFRDRDASLVLQSLRGGVVE